jgi:hypothetical protein
MTRARSRRSVPDRARRRAIRALATELGVAYSVAARLLEARSGAPGGKRFPIGGDEHRAWMFAAREHRSYLSRVSDARLAGEIPLGRAAHLARRFPPLRATAAAVPLYSGDSREAVLAMLYAVAVHDCPDAVPAPDELAWAAELGEEAAVDIACAALDRAARRLLDQDRWRLWVRVESALTAFETASDRALKDAAIALNRELRSTSLRGSVDGARQILDALLVEPFDGQPPGARVRIDGRAGTVVGVVWGSPVEYEVRFDDDPAQVHRFDTRSPDAALA